jgi:hypothetical protein
MGRSLLSLTDVTGIEGVRLGRGTGACPRQDVDERRSQSVVCRQPPESPRFGVDGQGGASHSSPAGPSHRHELRHDSLPSFHLSPFMLRPWP